MNIKVKEPLTYIDDQGVERTTVDYVGWTFMETEEKL